MRSGVQHVVRIHQRGVPVARDELEPPARAELPDTADREVPFDREREADVEHLAGLVETPLLHVEVGEVAPAARVDLVEVLRARAQDREHRRAALVPAAHQGADGVDQAGAHRQRRIVGDGGELGRLADQRLRLLQIAVLHREVGLRGERMAERSELRRCRRLATCLEDRNRSAGVLLGRAAVRVVPVVDREGLVDRAEPGAVALPRSSSARPLAAMASSRRSIR